MSIWAIADPHLSFGVPNKEMDIFGEEWKGYTEKIKSNWCNKIKPDDLVLIAGDISWAMHPEEAVPDLEWIHSLPGTKVIIRGNHDFWWASLNKVEKILPSSIHLIQNNVFYWNDVVIGGARLWDTSEYGFGKYIQYKVNPKAKPLTEEKLDTAEQDRIFQRELGRLEMSLKYFGQKAAKIKIAMTHYPPISADLQDSQASKILEKYGVNICVFGHLHNVNPNEKLFGEKNGIRYFLTSCDYLRFDPVCVKKQD